MITVGVRYLAHKPFQDSLVQQYPIEALRCLHCAYITQVRPAVPSSSWIQECSVVVFQSCPAMAQQYASLRGPTMVPMSFAYFTGKPGPSGFGSASTAEQVVAQWDGHSKVVVITGASSGLGAESARVLAAKGATIIMLVRNTAATQKVVDSIRGAYNLPADRFHIIECSLESLPSVKAAAQKVLDLNLPIHVLMLNAGVMAPPFGTTEQGIETQIGVNHVAHALLTRCLLPKVVATASAPGAPQGRIVSLSSSGHFMSPRHGLRARERINSPEGYNCWIAYGQSKLANVLFVRELSARLVKAGITNVAAVACHPGVIPYTNLPRHSFLVSKIVRPLMRPLLKNVEKGTATQVYAATAPGSLAPGEYFVDCNAAPSSKLAHDASVGAKLWSWTEQQLTGHVMTQLEAKQPIVW